MNLVKFGEVLDGTDHLRGVGVLVVIPGNNLDLIETFREFDDHGLGGIKEGTVGHADDVTGDELFLGVTEGSVVFGGGLHDFVDLGGIELFGFDDGDKDGGRTSWDWNTLGGTNELAIELWDDKADGLSSTSAVWNDVASGATGTAEIAFAVWAIEKHLVTGVSVDGGHDAALDWESVIESFGHWS